VIDTAAVTLEVLPEKVLLFTVAMSVLKIAPPPFVPALLPEKVLLLTDILPLL